MSIAQLQSARAPGQAAPTQVLPQQQSATPQAITGSLEKMPPQQLLAMYNNPQNTTPKWAVATAYAKAIEQARLMQAASGQSAMAQNQMQAGEPPVMQQVMSQPIPQEPVMAAYGGVMPGYAGGGAVAFSAGTGEEGVPDFSGDVAQALDAARVSEAEKNRKIDALKQQVEFLELAGAPQASAKKQELQQLMGAPAPKDMGRPEGLTAQQIEDAMSSRPTVSPSRPVVPQARGVVALPGASSAATRVAQTQKSFAPDYESQIRDLERSSGNVQSAIRTGAQPGEAVTAGRSDLRTQMLANLAAQQKEAQDYRDEITKRREERLAQATRPIWENPEALLRIAGGMNLERGKGIGSLASAAGSELGAQRKAAEEAKDRFMADQRDARQLDAANRAYQLAIAERQQAYAEGDDQAKRAADIKVAETQQNLAKTKIDISEKREQLGIQRLTAQAHMASANKPNETLALLQALFPGQAPSVENLAKIANARQPTAAERQDVAELRTLQANLQKQAENYILPKPQRDAAAAQLDRVNAKLAEMAGVGAMPTGGKTMTMADVQATAASSGRTVDEVKKAAMAKGYVIQ